MSSSAREAGLGIVPSIVTIAQAPRFLAKYFAPDAAGCAPYLSCGDGPETFI